MQYSITLSAGVAKRQSFAGRTMVILDTGAAATIDAEIEISGFAVERFTGIKKGFKLQAPGFTSATFTAAVGCTIEVIVTDANISVNYQDGAAVNATIVGPLPVPVSNLYGSPGSPLTVVGLTYSDLPAVTLQDNAAVAVTSAGAALVADNANRKAMQIANIGTDPVAIGFTGITWAKRAIVLNPGDIWTEDKAPNLAWSAITDAAKTASVTVQEVIR